MLCYYTTRFNNADFGELANKRGQAVCEHRVGFCYFCYCCTTSRRPLLGFMISCEKKQIKKHCNIKRLSALGSFLRKHANTSRCSSQVQRLELIPNPQRETHFLIFFLLQPGSDSADSAGAPLPSDIRCVTPRLPSRD